MAQLKITQIKGHVGERQYHRDSLRTLGLRKIGQSVVREDKPEVLGLVRAVRHLIDVEEVK